ncbi:MAG: ATP-binding protein, partial [Chloroflexi bacterium]|nr:ATP-binding protein [Chloroflexota bacterium]
VLYGRCDHAQLDPRRLFDQALRGSGVALPPVDDPSGLAEMLGRLLTGWATRWPILLVLDDLHLASDGTLDVVAGLTAWCQDMSVLVLGLFRTDAVDREQATNGQGRITLGGLDRGAVARICSAYGPDWSSDEVEALHRETGGVPLLVHRRASDLARQRAEERVDQAVGRLAVARAGLAAQSSSAAEEIDDLQRLLAQRRSQLATTVAGATPADTQELRSPYKGLARFEAADAAFFFGRERLVAELVTRSVGSPVLAVVGPSGSGKSSLVRAGFLPALAAGVLPERRDWASVTLSPGSHPAAELRQALDRLDAGAPGRVVFIDQFEEAFTLCGDDGERRGFLNAVAALTSAENTVVVLAVRADQFGALTDH